MGAGDDQFRMSEHQKCVGRMHFGGKFDEGQTWYEME